MRVHLLLAAAAVLAVGGAGVPLKAARSSPVALASVGTPGACTAAPEPTSTLPDTSTTVYSETGPSGTPPGEGVPQTGAGGRIDPVWTLETTALAATVAAHEGSPLVFIGDSITSRWITCGQTTWRRDFASRGALDLGIGGDTTQNVLWRVQHGALTGLHPKVVVLLIGTNDYHHVWTPSQVAQGVVATADAVRAALPSTRVVVLAVFPRDDPRSVSRRDVNATDTVLARTDFGPHIGYLDINADLLTASGAQRAGLFDQFQVHPTAAGYKVIAAALEAYRPIGRPGD